MSDLEKVVAYAGMLGSRTVMQLRWEAAGDAVHAASLLRSLKNETYKDGKTRIKFNAMVNLYEPSTDPIYQRALQNLQAAMTNATADQTCFIRGNVDITRKNQSLGQSKAHIMFVRNLMGTDGNGSSNTDDANELLGLHKSAIRNRSGSISGNGEMQIGMSGQPGLSQDVRVVDRDDAQAKNLFYGAKELANEAKSSGAFVMPNMLNKRGGSDFQDGEVMKNDGHSLGNKRTYYLTFQF